MTAAAPAPGRRASGVGLVLVGVLSVQGGAGLAKSLFPALGPGGTVLLRLAFAAALLAVVARPAVRRWDRSAWAAVLAFGVVLGGMNTSFYLALDRIPLGIAVAVEFVGPLGVAVLLSRRAAHLLWVGLAAGGLGLLALGSGEAGSALDPAGVVLALVAGVLWGLYILLSRRVGSVVPGQQGLAGALVVATLVAIPFGVGAGEALLDPALLLAGAGVALLSSVVPYSAELEALRRIPARLFGVLLSLEPVAAALVGLLVLGERLATAQWTAVALVCLASVGATVTARDGVPVAAPEEETAAGAAAGDASGGGRR